MAMETGIPPETMQHYASRIFERFPRLFLALGCPMLPAEFNLKPVDGAKVMVAETSACMFVELRLPRVGGLSDHQQVNSHNASVGGRDSMSPFSTSRKLVGHISRMHGSVLGGIESEVFAFGTDFDEPSEPLSPGPERSALKLLPHMQNMQNMQMDPGQDLQNKFKYEPPSLNPEDPGYDLGNNKAPDLPILLSAAALAHLSTVRRHSAGFQCQDPGKPALASPGSHDPWKASPGCYRSGSRRNTPKRVARRSLTK